MEKVTDTANNRTTEMRYDLAEREAEREVKQGGTQVYRYRVGYDDRGNVQTVSERVQTGTNSHTEYGTNLTYDADNRLSVSKYASSNCNTATTYDGLGRVSKKTHYIGSATAVNETFAYAAGSTAYSTNATTALVSQITNPNLTQTYAYDANGNVTAFTCAGVQTAYTYDSLGQLTRVNDATENATWTYEYDRGGNITSKKKYAYTTGTLGAVQQTIAYTYDGTWKDKLASVGGVTVTSDALGNLTNDGTWTYTWEGGRRLSGMSGSANIAFKYDENGQRISKTVGSATTNYTVMGKKVVHVRNSIGNLHIHYDGARPDMVQFNGAWYGYVLSLQGDVLGLRDSSGTLVVQYRYDAWGRQISKTGTLASTLGTLNPLRYRGYVYDEETGLYYLRSRYYNPNWGRFISTDALLGALSGLLHHNLFMYCYNNPIMTVDISGKDAYWLTSTGAAGTFGHAALAIADQEGQWYYISWGPEPTGIIAPAKMFVTPIDPDFANNSILDALNESIQIATAPNTENNPSINPEVIYSNAEFFEGDHTSSLKHARSLKSKVLNQPEYNYNLFTRNCMQIAASIMKQSYFDQKDVEFWGAMRRKLIPNIVMKHVQRIAMYHYESN